MFRTRLALPLVLVLMVASSVWAAPPTGEDVSPVDRAVPDLGTVIDANEISMFVTNRGSWAFDQVIGDAGLEWPKGTGRHAVFASGLWMGAKVGGELRLAVGAFAQEWAAGPLDTNGNPVDPGETDPAHRVYKIEPGDGPANPDWAEWPDSLGAPVDGNGDPLVIGEQTLWCVYNDAVASRHTNPAGSTVPLGVEVRQTAYALNVPGALGKTIFLEFEIENKGQSLLEEAYVSFWFDPDIGGFTDDLVGCDPEKNLGFSYNATNSDQQYGANPPTLGCVLLQGAIAGADSLGMTSFTKYINGTDPLSATQAYNYMQGLDAAGAPIFCDGEVTPYALSGDPVDGSGCVDDDPADRRMMLSSGPFTMAPGDQQHLVIAIIVGGEEGAGTHLSNVNLLRFYADIAEDYFRSGTEPSNQPPVCDFAPLAMPLVTRTPITFDASASFDPDGSIVSYDWNFGDGTSATGEVVDHEFTSGGQYNVLLGVTDDDGLNNACGMFITVFGPPATPSFMEVPISAELVSVDYLDLDPTHPAALVGVNWGGAFFGGGFDYGCQFTGSSIVHDEEALASCPSAQVAPERFGTVELRFDGTQKAYRYFRREVDGGGAPANVGRGYIYQDYADIPFTAVKIQDGVESQLGVMFLERQVTDDDGDPTGFVQPASQDGTWGPTDDTVGGREYISILDALYTGTPDPQFEQDGLFFSGMVPSLYGGWCRKIDEAAIIDPSDVIRFSISTDFGDQTPGVEVSWIDVDGDEDLDLHVANAGPDVLSINLNGRFTDSVRGLEEEGTASGAAWADIDNDGDPDLYLAHADGPNKLFRNDGAIFTDVADAVLAAAGASAAVAWADYDRDGLVDLFLGNTDGSNRLFRNQGANQWVDVTPPILMEDPGITRDALWADVDDDGDPDLYLCNAGANRLLVNVDGAFVDTTSGPMGDPLTTLGGAWGDYDNDLDLDLYLANSDGANKLLRNDGGAVFTDVTAGPLGDAGDSQSASWLDIDHDGDLDLYVINATTPNRVLMNQANGKRSAGADFVTVSIPVLDGAGDGPHGAWGDYDGDGDLDLYMANSGANKLVRGELSFSRWLQIALSWQDPNTMGIGARVRIETASGSQIREVTAQDGHAAILAFGLGTDETVSVIEVRWPSGHVQMYSNVDANQRVQVFDDVIDPVELASFEAVSGVGQVTLSWVVSHATDHAGFHVARADEIAGVPRAYDRLTDHDTFVTGSGPDFEYIDDTAVVGKAYLYQLEAVGTGGETQFFGPVRGTPQARVYRLALHQNHPNPFRPAADPATAIRFEVPARSSVTLAIYDVSGRLIRRLVRGDHDPGVYTLRWDGRTEGGRLGSAGVYLYELVVGDEARTRKLLLLR